MSADGPFSRFDGYDRHIMLVDGRGMTLDCGPHGRVELTEPFVPRTFSGDWDVQGTLVAGPVRDFNLVVDRARATSSLEVRVLAGGAVDLQAQGITIVHVLEGALHEAAAADTLVADASSVRLTPRGGARVAIARVVRRSR